MVKDYIDPPPPPPDYFSTRAKKQESDTDTHNPAASWLNDETRANIQADDTQAMLRAVATLASAWIRTAGTHPACWPLVTHSEIAGCLRNRAATPTDPVQRTFLAAGCDMLDLLALSPQGRQAIEQLGFKPVSQHAKAKG